jgi:ABC-2 type transport system permease protein
MGLTHEQTFLRAKSVETASNIPMPLISLPLLGSGFVPTDTMPVALRWFAEFQSLTPIIETVRGLLMGTTGSSAVIVIAWCAGITVVCFQWARRAYNRDPVR